MALNELQRTLFHQEAQIGALRIVAGALITALNEEQKAAIKPVIDQLRTNFETSIAARSKDLEASAIQEATLDEELGSMTQVLQSR